MPQCCFCFLQASGECGSDPTGGAGATGLWEGRSYPARQPKRNTGLNPAGPALGKPRGHRGTLGLRGMWLVLPTLGLRHGPGTSSARGSSWSDRQRDFWWSKDWKNQVPRLLSSLNRQNRTTLYLQAEPPQFAAVMKLLPSAEVNVSRAEAALLANRRGHPVPPTVLPKHKGHSQGTTPHQTP